ncbi:ABC transporter permease [Propionibacterium freudenreichii]|uniref:ABC-type antimicrobial peptide transporter, permease component n=1 Tax=Propionibacterium freudenreichii TaxID=1744 RepID=A0A0A8QYY8_9ACTN|nr:ABC transporter permease [Propionibacterium freudenreichii]AJQ89829.1 ABC-type antimicrobial peptide transporter, permease component [Propionibacterium freudenreichii subsp. freudenreichii]ARO11200.1 hypothetical protein BMR99_00370 [Propionibacterium freudenreichii]AWY94796.1 ABC-type antimicrobial peptide transporter, permease component [Propionibacterium freudenreichii]MCT2974756.1 ABC transporter permease [Propionibacterium freudenreichii]MCT2977013.1 ABC transporter permease [Propionib
MRSFGRELWWDLLGNKTNFWLSCLALFVALFSFIAVVSTGTLAHDSLLAKTLMVDGVPTSYRAEIAPAALRANSLTGQLADDVSAWNRAGLESAVAMDFSQQLAGQPITVRAIAGNYQAIKRVKLTDGRWNQARPYPGEVVANQPLAARQGSNTQLSLGTTSGAVEPFVVTGSLADGDARPVAYTDLTSYFATTGWYPTPATVELLFHTDKTPDQIAAAIAPSLTALGLATNDKPMRIDRVDSMADQVTMFTAAFTAVTLIGLVVAALGMMNVGLASVRERSRDFTIRRALGATQGRIIAQVLAETLATGIVATLAAIGTTWALLNVLLPRLLPPSWGLSVPAYPWPITLLAAAAGLTISAASGLIPALRVRKLELAAILRA